MAYVGTPRARSSDIETLASILQGEAGGEGLRGLQAVANVIQNRAGKNFSGYGASLLDQALARNQFQGQSTKVGPEALTVAEQLVGGGLPDITNGALYYANPGASTASWARRLNDENALKIGNHYFTDNANGVPFSNPYANMPDGPKGQESYPAPTTTFGTLAPAPAKPAMGPIPDYVAQAATPEDQQQKGFLDRFSGLAKAFDDAIPDVPRPSAFPGGPSEGQAMALQRILQNPNAFAQALLKRRVV